MCKLQWGDVLKWCLSNEWDEVSKSSQFIYISSSMKTYLRFPTTASVCSWSATIVCSWFGWICLHQTHVLRRCVQVVSKFCLSYVFIFTIMLHKLIVPLYITLSQQCIKVPKSKLKVPLTYIFFKQKKTLFSWKYPCIWWSYVAM